MVNKLDIIRYSTQQAFREEVFATLKSYSDLFPTSKDAKILLKPNLNSNMNALTGNTTDLRILSILVQFFKELGYDNIIIGEGTNSGFYRNRIGVISRLRIDALARYYGIKVKDLNYAESHEVLFDKGVKTQVARDCLEADLFINLPKLKTHFETGMSVCLKNLMGCLVGQESKKKTHLNLPANILRLNKAVRPHLHIVDGLIAMEGLGPSRGMPVRLDTIIIGTDPYLVDLVCCRLAKFDYKRVSTLRVAEEKGLLNSDHHTFVDTVDFKGIPRQFKPPKANLFARFIHNPKRQRYFMAIRNTPLFSYLASTKWFGQFLYLTGLRQDKFLREEMHFSSLNVDENLCDECTLCRDYCPLGQELPKDLGPSNEACIGCLYCYMVCPLEAINFEGNWGFLEEQMRQYDHVIRKLHNRRVKGNEE
jgi:uncharacterized protein (DUF362 family)/ferredoxin